LDQLELQLADLEENAAQAKTAAQMAAAEKITVAPFERRRPVRRPLPEHLPRERIVYPIPATCPCCGDNRLRKIGEDVSLRSDHNCQRPRTQSRVDVQDPSCWPTSCSPSTAFHLPLHRQSEVYQREGIDLDARRSPTGWAWQRQP
jgi:transposase